MDNLKCVLLSQRHVTKSYTVPKDEVRGRVDIQEVCASPCTS